MERKTRAWMAAFHGTTEKLAPPSWTEDALQDSRQAHHRQVDERASTAKGLTEGVAHTVTVSTSATQKQDKFVTQSRCS